MSEIRVDRRDLGRALQMAAMPVRKRPSLPQLAMVRLQVADGRLTVTGTDLETTVSATVDCWGEPGGDCLVPPRMLSALLRAHGDRVDLDVPALSGDTHGNLGLHGAGASGRVRAVPVDDWPDTVAPVKPEDAATWTPDDVDRLAAALPFTSRDESRPILNAVSISGGMVAATDSYRLIRVDGAPDRYEGLVPSTAVAMVVTKARNVDVTIGYDLTVPAADSPPRRRFRASWERDQVTVELAARETDGTFPDVGKLIPSTDDPSARTATVDLRPLLRALKRHRSVIAATGRHFRRTMPVLLQPDGGALRIVTDVRDPEVHLETTVDVEWPDIPIAVNNQLAVDVIGALPAGEPTTVLLRDGLKPMWLSAGPVDAVLMPMRVS